MKTNSQHNQIEERSARTIFLTGATGNIGAALLQRLLERDPTARLVLLVRGDSSEQARHRVETALHQLSPQFDLAKQTSRIRVLTGDITRIDLGLEHSTFQKIARTVTEIVHCAAATKFLLPLSCARTINVTGTANILTLAEAIHRHGCLRQMVHVSTAFVCGDRTGIVYEEDCTAPTGFANSYEQTKWEGEQLVRARMPELPITIARPSVVVGDSRTGRTKAFNVLYTPLRLIHERKLTRIPSLQDAPLDVVPLDYVADALAHITLNYGQTTGRTFHLVAGREGALDAREIVTRAVQIYELDTPGGRPRQVSFVSPALYNLVRSVVSKRTRRLWQLAEPYLPYLISRKQFDHTHTDELLGPVGISPPPLSDYLEIILRYALQTNWGRGCQLDQRAA